MLAAFKNFVSPSAAPVTESITVNNSGRSISSGSKNDSNEAIILAQVDQALDKKRCSKIPTFKVSNVVLTLNALNNAGNGFADLVFTPPPCAPVKKSIIGPSISAALTFGTQLGQLYNYYDENQALQKKLLDAIRYTDVEQCYATNATHEVLEGEITPDSLTAFITKHRKVTVKMIGSADSFELQYIGLFSVENAYAAVGIVLTGLSYGMFLGKSLSDEVQEVIAGGGPMLDTAIDQATTVPFLTIANALWNVFDRKRKVIYEAGATMVRYETANKRQLSEEALAFLAVVVEPKNMLKIRKANRNIGVDVEAANPPSRHRLTRAPA